MPTANNFISYSRTDSGFALKLAKDLRKAGANIWIDQLDIKPGNLWDIAIEAALKSSHNIIVILSTESIRSMNVTNEYSFALENNKTIIPVLLNVCEIPFRLSRFQRVDFTGDYQSGLNNLHNALDLYNEDKINLDTGIQDEFTPNIVANNADFKLWQEAKDTNTIASYQKFLNEAVSDLHIQEAHLLLNQLEKEFQLDKNQWEKAKDENTISAYDHYIMENPYGKWTSYAADAIRKFKESELQQVSKLPDEVNYSHQEIIKKGNANKYMLFGGAGILIALVILWIFKYNSGNSEISTSETNQIIKDVKDTSIDKGIQIDSTLKIGTKYLGGIIFHISNNSKHGLIVTEKDLGKFKMNDAMRKCADLGDGWRLPDTVELNMLYINRDKVGGFTALEYWSSSEGFRSQGKKGYYAQNLITGKVGVYGNDAKPIRAVRSF